ncbi:MAG TPA: signal peptidase I [Firmicutes bacterium]|nr:signal peptidase I [Bacillota bacterium]
MTIARKVKKAWNLVTTVVVLLVAAAAVLLVGLRLFGLQTYTVLSGSMEPTYPTGSLLYVRKAAPEEVTVGQPITFVLNEDLVVATHRVIAIDAENQYFYTKGDANEAADGAPVHFNNLIGVPVFHIPYLGYVANYVQKPPGLYVTIAAGAVLLFLLFLPDLLGLWKKEEKTPDASDPANGPSGAGPSGTPPGQ